MSQLNPSPKKLTSVLLDLVHRVARKSPPNLECLLQHSEGQFGLKSSNVVWSEAVEWSAQAWTAVYNSLITRQSVTIHSIAEDPASEFLYSLAALYLTGKAIVYLKAQFASVFALSAEQTELPAFPVVNFPSEGLELSAYPGPLAPCVGGWKIMKLHQSILAGGWVYRACVRMRNSGCPVSAVSKGATQFLVAYDLLNAKAACARAPDSFILKSLKDHREAMTRVSAPMSDDKAVLKAKIVANIRELTRKIYRGKELNMHDVFPSTSSCFEGARKSGGAAGKLFEAWRAQRAERLQGSYTVDIGHLWAMTATGVGRAEEWKPSVHEVECEDELSTWFEFVASECREELKSRLPAEVVSIPEPLKVRNITKGPAATYYLAEILQKTLHRAMRKSPAFQFIGKPIDDASWASRFRRAIYLADDEILVSGDYKAATDNLDPDLIEEVVRALGDELQVQATKGYMQSILTADTPLQCDLDKDESEEVSGISVSEVPRGSDPERAPSMYYSSQKVPLRESLWFTVLRSCLSQHKLFYNRETGLMEADQLSGQLMGSPISFPILCLINVAATLVGMGKTVKELFEPDFPLIANGDDIAFVCKLSDYPLWQEVVTLAGLSPSMGKNYTSRNFIIVNSQLRWRPRPDKNDNLEMTCLDLDAKAYERYWSLDHDHRMKTGERLWLEKPLPSTSTYDWWRAGSKYNYLWQLSGFVNLSLMLGIEKKGPMAGCDLTETLLPWELGRRARDMLVGLPPTVQDAAMSEFLKQHKSVLELCHPAISWFLPRSLGGLGLPVTREVEQPEYALKLAAYLSCLSPLQRLKATLPPSTRSKVFFDVAAQRLKKVLSTGHAEETRRIVANPEVPLHAQACGHSRLSLGWTLRETRFEGKLSFEQTNTAQQRLPLLFKYRNNFAKLLQKSKRCSLTPMDQSKALSYAEEYYLFEREGDVAASVSRWSLDQPI